VKPLENKKLLIKIAVAAVCVVVVIVVVLTIVSIYTKPVPEIGSGLVVVPSRTGETEVSINKLPVGFPTNIPLEKNAKVVQNYNATGTDGRSQATRVFESKLTLDQNYKIYTNFFQANSWKIDNKYQSASLDSIFASNGQGQLAVNISKNSVSGVVTVNLSYVY